MTAPSRPDAAAPSRAARFARAHWLELATVLAALSVYAAIDLPWTNVDEYMARAFQGDFAATYAKVLSDDAATGRFRPLYWLLTGLAGAPYGASAALLVWFRLLFLGANVWLQQRIALRLGAPAWAASLLALAAAWSRPALAIWPHGGPAEAFANPLALACTLLVLRAEGVRAVLLAAAAGLCAALVKESFGAWTAVALAAFALIQWLRGHRGAPLAAAAAGAAAQLLPSVVATLAATAWGASYASHVVTTLNASVSTTALFTLDEGLMAASLAAVSLPVLAAPLFRHPRTWPLEEVLVLGLLGSTLVLTFALGFVMPRYHLPLVTAGLLAAARASRKIADLPRARWVGGAAAALLVVADAAGAARAAVELRTINDGRAVHERVRTQLRAALERYGSARVYWIPDQVEVAIGAVRHLRADGVRSPVELLPCYQPSPDSAELLLSYFREYSVPVPRWTVVIAQNGCPGAVAALGQLECHLQLPGIAGLRPRYDCWRNRDLSAVVFAP